MICDLAARYSVLRRVDTCGEATLASRTTSSAWLPIRSTCSSSRQFLRSRFQACTSVPVLACGPGELSSTKHWHIHHVRGETDSGVQERRLLRFQFAPDVQPASSCVPASSSYWPFRCCYHCHKILLAASRPHQLFIHYITRGQRSKQDNDVENHGGY